MTFIDNKTELYKYAKYYSSTTSSNLLKNLIFNELPPLFSKYKTGKNALDFGCGTGYSTKFLKSYGFKTTGVDINPEMIKIAKQKDAKGEYITVIDDIIPFKEKTFDLVFSSFVLLEINSLKTIQSVLYEINRVLKVGGKFFAVLNNKNMYSKNWPSVNTNFLQNKHLKSGQKVKIQFLDKNFSIEDYYWTEDDYLKAMKKANLEFCEIYNKIGNRDSPISIYITQKLR